MPFSFDTAPLIAKSKASKKRAEAKLAVDIMIASIIDPWAFAYPTAELVMLSDKHRRIILRRRSEAMQKARECQRVYELHRPKRTVVFPHNGHKLFRKV